ncbi:DUF934 domain-containing protein [Gemmobacter lutimaris]|uniref:DUF934 domain-containing protein n=1 Tax=Gemmobacter lutimaris TaxID=2306023 RepID=A0A398BQR9_9RHOB|nr:DUF934 domain-containing protein [Gemmobacter lutimaris]RID91261.1 DUF934 domain-containing protein [Gemmobacter lutimaris]
MSVIVTDTGFTPVADSQNPGLDAAATATALDLAHTDDPSALADRLEAIALIRVAFPAFSDGRAFTIGRRLRMMGYKGELRAFGHVIADQYAMARRVGFDAVEIPDDLAARQPEPQWKFRADWQAHDYQSRLRA